ncbi:hypothetical protein MKX01_028204 [Papaver californicum]|nr:hypothetical protein MKX01_028204 [Papaver californicum]
MEPNNQENVTYVKKEEEEQVVTPWKVASKGKIDYDKLIDQFGCQSLDPTLVQRVEHLTSRPAHVFLRRGVSSLIGSEVNGILDAYENGGKFYLYTGRGPSSEALHLGHLIPFMFTNFAFMLLVDAFKVPLVIQLTDDEKYLWKRPNDLLVKMLRTSLHFFFFCSAFYKNMIKVAKYITFNQVHGIFGFTPEDHIGKIGFPPVQAYTLILGIFFLFLPCSISLKIFLLATLLMMNFGEIIPTLICHNCAGGGLNARFHNAMFVVTGAINNGIGADYIISFDDGRATMWRTELVQVPFNFTNYWTPSNLNNPSQIGSKMKCIRKSKQLKKPPKTVLTQKSLISFFLIFTKCQMEASLSVTPNKNYTLQAELQV